MNLILFNIIIIYKLQIKEYSRAILDSIFENSCKFPIELEELFSNIKEYAIEEFPFVNDIRYSSISAFIFLRLFSPAIINPQLFGLIDENLKAREVRTLTLISKFVQQTANLVEYKNSKEPYMCVLNDLIKEYIPFIKKYIDSITRIHRKSIIKPKKIFFGMFKKKGNENEKNDEKDKIQIDLEKRFSSLHRIINRNLGNIENEVNKNNNDEEKKAYNELKVVIEKLNNIAGITVDNTVNNKNI